MTTCTDWLNRLCSLNVAKTERRGRAPHKPLLLLCVMDMVEEGVLITPWLCYSPELFFRFQDYWEVVYERQNNKPDMRLPFHALGGERDQIWERYTEDGAPSRSRETTRLCRIDEMLWGCLQDASFRREARLRLIITYFTAEEQISLCERLKLTEPSTAEIAAVKENTATYKMRLVKGRDGRFRTTVLLNYKFTCALTGYSLNTDKENIVEAAHIHQHSISGNDDPRNGLALTPDAHWMFDRGLWTAEPRNGKFIVLVALDSFNEASQYNRSLRDYHEKPLFISESANIIPHPKHFEWHRKYRFLG
jgi:putative restriction endonuclease